MGQPSEIYWSDLFQEGKEFDFLQYLDQAGFQCMIPHQAYLDNLYSEMLAMIGMTRNYHLMSPKHKLQLWFIHPELTLHIEYFPNYPLPPYGVISEMEWSDYREIAEQTDLFELLDIELQEADQTIKYMDSNGEDFEIAETVNVEMLEESMQIVEYSMNNFEHILLAYSAGKDSSVCLQLYLHYYLKNPLCKAKLTIISADTLIENPLLNGYLYQVKERVESLKMGITFHIVKPDLNDTYYVCVFGKGYTVPSTLSRWCVSRLKKDPADRVLMELAEAGDKVCLVLGTRSAESKNRERSVKRHFGDEFFREHPLHQITTCSPIRNWEARDVVTYLVRTETPWKNLSNYNLINLYGSALSMGECPIGAAIVNEHEDVSSCTSGKTPRLGCVFCTVVKDDRSLMNMAKDYEELEPLLEMRVLFKASQDIRYGSRTGYQRDRKMIHLEDDRYEASLGSGFGDLTLDVRTLLLNEMKKLNITIPEDEIREIYYEVRNREFKEGIALTERFQAALFSHLPVHPGYFDTSFSPIWDPWGCGVDMITNEDKKAIERILSQRDTKQLRLF